MQVLRGMSVHLGQRVAVHQFPRKADVSSTAVEAKSPQTTHTAPAHGHRHDSAEAARQMTALAEARASEQAVLASALKQQLELAAAFADNNPTMRPTQQEAIEGLLRRAKQVDVALLETASAKSLSARFPEALVSFST